MTTTIPAAEVFIGQVTHHGPTPRTHWAVNCKADGDLWSHRAELTQPQAERLAERVRAAGAIDPTHWEAQCAWEAVHGPDDTYDWAAENQDLVARRACYR